MQAVFKIKMQILKPLVANIILVETLNNLKNLICLVHYLILISFNPLKINFVSDHKHQQNQEILLHYSHLIKHSINLNKITDKTS